MIPLSKFSVTDCTKVGLIVFTIVAIAIIIYSKSTNKSFDSAYQKTGNKIWIYIEPAFFIIFLLILGTTWIVDKGPDKYVSYEYFDKSRGYVEARVTVTPQLNKPYEFMEAKDFYNTLLKNGKLKETTAYYRFRYIIFYKNEKHNTIDYKIVRKVDELKPYIDYQNQPLATSEVSIDYEQFDNDLKTKDKVYVTIQPLEQFLPEIPRYVFMFGAVIANILMFNTLRNRSHKRK